MANTVSIHVQSIDNTNEGFEKVQKRFGDSMKAMGVVAAMAGPQLAGPLVAAAGASVAAVASIGVSVGALGAAVIPQFQSIISASKLYSKAQGEASAGTAEGAKKLEAYRAAMKNMTPATRATAVAFGGLKDDFKKWSDSLSSTTMPIFTKGLQSLRGVLPLMTPLAETAAGAFKGLMNSFSGGLKSGGFKSFLTDLNTSAKVTLPDFLNSLKNIGVGFGGIIRAFLPFSGTMTGGLERITAKFREFGQNLSGSKGFTDFMDGVKAVVPGILQLFGNLAKSAEKVIAAFMPFSGVMLTLVEAFAGFLASIDPSKLEFIVPMISAIVVGMKAWAIVTGVVTAAQEGLTAVMGLNPWTGAILAVTALAVALYSTKDASDMAAMGLTGVGDAAESSESKMKDAAGGLLDALLNTVKWVDRLGGLMPETAGKTKVAADKLGDFGASADFASTSVSDFGEQTGKASESAAKAAAKVGVFTDALRALGEQQLAMSGSLIGLEASFDAAAEAVKKNGKTLDIHTPKGRANTQALNSIATAALSVRDKMNAAGESGEAVAKKMNYARENFVSLAVKMGLSSKAARTLADSLGLIKNKDVTVTARTAEALANVKKMKDYIAGLHGKTLTITTYSKLVNEGKAPAYQHYAHGGIVGHAAEGGPRNGMTWVGEQGPELVSLPVGSIVHTAGDSQRIASTHHPKLTEASSSSYGGARGGVPKQAALAFQQLIDSIDGKITTIRAKFNSVISIIKKEFSGSQEDTLVAYSKRQLAAMEKLATKRDALAKKITAYQDFSKGVADTVRGYASLDSIEQRDRTKLGIASSLGTKLSLMRTFADALKRLSKRGLANALFQQIVGLGPEAGTQMANEFLSMNNREFAQVNSFQNQINKISGTIGNTAANKEIPGSAAIAKHIASLEKAMDKMADKFADKIAAALLKASHHKGRTTHKRRSTHHKRKATGGPAGGMTWVGEEGPELLNLPYGSSVTTAGASRRMAAASAAGQGGGVIRLEWVGGSGGDEFMTFLKKNIRAIAGNGPDSVQRALGV